MTTSQILSQGTHLNEKSDFRLLRLYIEQEVSHGSLQQLVETIQNSKDSETCFYPFIIPIRLDKCYQISDSFTEFIIHQQKHATNFAQQIIYKNVRNLCSHSNQIVVRFMYDKLPPRPEFRILSNASQADLLSRAHPIRLSGTVIASSAILPYVRGLKYVCQRSICPLNDRKRQKFISFTIDNPHNCTVGQKFLCEGCDLMLDEDINKRWISEKVTIAIKLKEPEIPILSSIYNLELETLLSNTYTVIVRDEFISHIRLGGKYNFICYVLHDLHLNQVVFETLHCEMIQPSRLTLPDSICQLHHNFAHHHSFSFLNILSTLFCPHIRLAKYCIHVKMGLILSLVSSSIHVLIVGNESRVADILCQTAFRYAQCGVIHRQQHPLTLASFAKNKHHSFIVSAGSIAVGNDGITYLESIDSLTKSQIKELLSG
ncbi:unnamed protein product [Rotaria socialis]